MKPRSRLAALLLLLTALVWVAACSQSHGGTNDRRGGAVQIKLSAPTSTGTTAVRGTVGSAVPAGTTTSSEDDGGVLSKLAHVNVTFSDLLARNLDGDLINMTIDLPHTVDLMTLVNGGQITLPTGTLPPGMYDQLVVVIKNVEFVFLDGTSVVLTPPGGGWTRIVPVTPFEVVDGQTITIDLHFRPGQAFGENGGEFEFFPDFDCDRD
jgi:uncharacterized protein DUF4382